MLLNSLFCFITQNHLHHCVQTIRTSFLHFLSFYFQQHHCRSLAFFFLMGFLTAMEGGETWKKGNKKACRTLCSRIHFDLFLSHNLFLYIFNHDYCRGSRNGSLMKVKCFGRLRKTFYAQTQFILFFILSFFPFFAWEKVQKPECAQTASASPPFLFHFDGFSGFFPTLTVCRIGPK